MGDTPYDHLKYLRKNRDDAARRVATYLRDEWPVGAAIRWRRFAAATSSTGGHCHGVVTGHGGGERIKVRNAVTGREYWIHAYDMDVEAADA